MTRNRASAKKAGTAHETAIANYLAEHVDDRIERRTGNGGKDRGAATDPNRQETSYGPAATPSPTRAAHKVTFR